MGLAFVFLFWAVAGTIVAGIGAATLGYATAVFTRCVTSGRRQAIHAAILFPFVCLGWGGGVFVLQAVINEEMLHREIGLGDTWQAPLPNGYQIMMIDVTDQGMVYNPKTQHSDSGVGEQEDAFQGVRDLQVAGRYILGAADSKAFAHLGENSNQVDSFFLADTQTGKRAQFQNYDALRNRALELNIEPSLQPLYSVYAKYRFGWFDVFTGLLFLVPPAVGALLLVRRILRLRRTRPLVLQTL